VPTCAAIGQDFLGGIWALGAARGSPFRSGDGPALIAGAQNLGTRPFDASFSGRSARLEATTAQRTTHLR
jgi:hypothetical protein